MKTITLEEMVIKIKPGDLFYAETSFNSDHTGWKIYMGDNFTIGLNTECTGSHGTLNNRNQNITKVIFFKDVEYKNKFAEFVRRFDESKIEDYIIYIAEVSQQETELENLINKLKQQLKEAESELNYIKTNFNNLLFY